MRTQKSKARVLRQPSSRCWRFDESTLATMYLNSRLHFSKTLTTSIVLKKGYWAGEGSRNDAIWGIARRLKNMKVVLNVK